MPAYICRLASIVFRPASSSVPLLRPYNLLASSALPRIASSTASIESPFAESAASPRPRSWSSRQRRIASSTRRGPRTAARIRARITHRSSRSASPRSAD